MTDNIAEHGGIVFLLFAYAAMILMVIIAGSFSYLERLRVRETRAEPPHCETAASDEALIDIIGRSIARTAGIKDGDERARDVLDSIRRANFAVPRPASTPASERVVVDVIGD